MTSSKKLNNRVRIFCGTRTGTKAHIAVPGSSSCMCGHWMRFQASAYVLPLEHGREVCQRCVQTCHATPEQMIAAGRLVAPSEMYAPETPPEVEAVEALDAEVAALQEQDRMARR